MLTLVPTPIGNIEDISARALKALEKADIFLCEDTRVTKKLLGLVKQKYNIAPAPARFISLHSHNEKKFLQKIDPSFFDKNVVYVSDAGMPGISDPGAILVDYCIKNGIEYDVLPGPSAFVTAYAASGFNSSRFLFFGFLPHKGHDRKRAFENVMNSGFDTIIYESPHRLLKLFEEIVAYDCDREVFAVKELTKKFQKYYRGKVVQIFEKLKNENIKGEWVVIIKASEKKETALDINDILSLDIPKKQAAKLLSKITGKSIKECYNHLLRNETS
ncbi:16S rRNA (cytidine(1402)-2'-O)-methyltransferase [Nitrosophilus alvini]|uniref:16S rRNA (cytidine(1402)-2'-O)-methyltransferase n=1 Tax=Nitrosophilus alvini TaxID=2714855 RepID=UPI001909A171|nr:16S rRNA (cytidine(1402)-2'-O)-methyltransferase [Nitrosophilus alvini]